MQVQKYNLDAINACREQIDQAKPKFGSAGDSFQNPNSGDFGPLPGAQALASAVTTLSSDLRTELKAAEKLCDQIARSLDNVLRSVQATERANTEALTVQPGGHGG